MGRLLRIAAAMIAALSAAPAVHAGANAPAATSSEPGKSARDKEMQKKQQELEAVAMQILIAPMFQSGSSKMFGTGSAGKYWQSMLTEQIAQQIVARNRFRLIPVSARQKPTRTAGSGPSIGRVAPQTACAAPCADVEIGPGGWRTMVIRPVP